MAASMALFDVHFHLARAAGRLPRMSNRYEPAHLEQAIEGLAGESQKLRHSVAATLLSTPRQLTSRHEQAVFDHLVPEAGPDSREQLVRIHRDYVTQPAARRTPMDPRSTADELHSTVWIPSGVLTEVMFDSRSVTARAWHLVSKPLEEIAPRLNPQNWDADRRFIDAAFGISRRSDCTVDHRREEHETLLPPEYADEVLHEAVSASFPVSLAVDLTVSFRKDFGAPVANHALYQLRCDHAQWLDRDEGHCYVRETDDGRLVYLTKHLSFTSAAPDFLLPVVAILLPEWLQSILQLPLE